MYAYNRDRQPTLVTRPDGQTVAFGYESGGRLSTLTLPTGIVRYAYSPTTGQVSTVTAPDGGTLSYKGWLYRDPLKPVVELDVLELARFGGRVRTFGHAAARCRRSNSIGEA